MAFIIPTEWTAGTYTAGDEVLDGGVVYRAISDRTSADTVRPSLNTNWEVVSVINVNDYNSVVEAVRLQLNVRNNPEINDSIPLFIQLTEESFKTRIRAPQMRMTTILTVDSESRIRPPGDLIEVINLRLNSDVSPRAGVFGNEVIEILNSNYEEFQRVRAAGRANNNFTNDSNAFESAVYWFDSTYFHLAPTYEAGTEIELVYYKVIPQLGSSVLLTDANGNPVNAAGQTLAQWTAAGNTADSFVQASQTVTRNWFTSAVPQLLVYGACLRGKVYLRDDDPRIAQWEEMYAQAELEVHEYINTFEDSQPHAIYITNTYSMNI